MPCGDCLVAVRGAECKQDWPQQIPFFIFLSCLLD